MQLYAVGPPIYTSILQLLTITPHTCTYVNARMQCDTDLHAWVGIFVTNYV